jgi:hypothetical protein
MHVRECQLERVAGVARVERAINVMRENDRAALAAWKRERGSHTEPPLKPVREQQEVCIDDRNLAKAALFLGGVPRRQSSMLVHSLWPVALIRDPKACSGNEVERKRRLRVGCDAVELILGNARNCRK